ncbi:MAG: DUF1460 domain-containing protein [Deltaproteobacteria bacterium]|nr:DUF1460 domain-containing protein [Deltaproteobacteria bacterium]
MRRYLIGTGVALLSFALSRAVRGEPGDDEVPAEEAPTAAGQVDRISVGSLPAALVELASAVRAQPIAARMEAVSRPMLGQPYRSDPLGEGEGYDPDPPARYDVWDCLTFVEEVLALSLAGDPAHAASVRTSLRYGDRTPSYATRHHFMELQWLPEAQAQGWLVDTTRTYGAVQRMRREVHRGTWDSWSRRSLFALTDAQLPLGTMHLDVLSIDEALRVVDQLRPGSVLLTVRQDRAWVPIWTTHLGFLIPAERPTVRHATRMQARVVKDHSLTWYLEHLRTYTNWPVAGVAVFEPREQGPRLSALPQGRDQGVPTELQAPKR